MLLRWIAIVMLSMALFAAPACSTYEGEAKELFETAQFEELQRNTKHAKKLYEDIVKRYPDTQYAAKAKARLEQLER